jgi:cell division protein FtsA
VGMAGSRLEVEAVIVTAAGTSLQNLYKSVERAGVAVEETVLGPFASGEAVLQAAEKDLGAVVADIGAGTTDIAIYEQGSLWFSSSIPVGGDYITSDLAVGLRTTISQAEKVKQDSGCALPGLASDSDVVSITAVGEKGNRLVSRKALGDIIQPRAEEILSLIKREIKRSGYRGMLPGGCVLTGGTAALDGLVELAREVLEMPVRVGIPENVGGLADVVSSPRFATCIGLLMYGARYHRDFGDVHEHFRLGSFFSSIRAWFQDLFS